MLVNLDNFAHANELKDFLNLAVWVLNVGIWSALRGLSLNGLL